MTRVFSGLLTLCCVSMISVSLVHAGIKATFNYGFETGDLTDWVKTGNAFDFQPTWGDNPTARNRGQPSKHEGDWWIGTYEKYQGPVKGKGQKAGDRQGDVPTGTLTSIKFPLRGNTMNFLIGGGTHPWKDDPKPCCVNLKIEGEVVRTSTGQATETMSRQEWHIAEFKGEKAQLEILDLHDGGWGHPNVDDFHQADASGKNISWQDVMASATAIEAGGKLAAIWGQVKKY